MRISRRFSRSAAAGAATVITALSMTACSGSSSGSSSTASSAASQSLLNANENDVQVLNSLQLTTQELDSAFATDRSWQVWTGADPSKILLKQALACTQNIIDTSQKSLQPVTSYFQADSLPGDQATAPTTPTSSSSKGSSSHKGSSSPTSSGPGSSAADDGNPAHWVVSTAIAYKSADAARAAVAGMGTVDTTTPAAKAMCGGPGDGATKQIVGGGIGEVGPSWDNSQGVFVYTDTQSHVTISVVGQRRGRYVVLTYTRGLAKADGGYYDLEAGKDTDPAADAATGVLGQLTAAVVGSGS